MHMTAELLRSRRRRSVLRLVMCDIPIPKSAVLNRRAYFPKGYQLVMAQWLQKPRTTSLSMYIVMDPPTNRLFCELYFVVCLSSVNLSRACSYNPQTEGSTILWQHEVQIWCATISCQMQQWRCHYESTCQKTRLLGEQGPKYLATRKPSYRWQTRATRKPAKIAPIRRAYNAVADIIGLSSFV